MAAHLRFNSKTGVVEPRSPDGQHTEELLQLNDDALIQYRLGTLRTVRMYSTEIEEHERQLLLLARLLREGRIAQDQFDDETLSIQHELEELRSTMKSYTGELALPPLHKQRLGISLLAP